MQQRFNQRAREDFNNKEQQKDQQIKTLTQENEQLKIANQKNEQRINELLGQLQDLQENFEKLKKNIIDPNQVLLSAAKEGDLNKAKMSLELGANLETVDSKGQTPLFISLLNGHTDVASFFLAKDANLIVVDNDKQTILDRLFEKNDFETPSFIMDEMHKSDKEGISLLSFYEYANDNKAKQLIATTLLYQAAKQGNQELAQKALQLGAQINAQDRKILETALHKAAYARQYDLVRFLLDNGSSCTIKDKYGQIPSEVTADKKIQALISDFMSQQAIKIQAHARGFFARKAYKAEVLNLGSDVAAKLFKEGKFDEVYRLTKALQDNHLAEALKIIHTVGEESNKDKKTPVLK